MNQLRSQDQQKLHLVSHILCSADYLYLRLVTDTSGDFQIGTMQFLQEFQSRFGDRTPIWFIGTIEEAAKEAYGSQSKAAERKMLGKTTA